MSHPIADKNIRHLYVIREWGRDLGLNTEIKKCLEEYYGIENVEVLIVPNHIRADIAMMDAIHEFKPAYIYMDSRIFIVNSKMLSLVKHLIEITFLNLKLKKANVIPICFVTDAQAPGYCLVADLLIHKIGYVVPMGSNFRYENRDRYRKLPGQFNPISESTAVLLSSNDQVKTKNVYLGGSLYEPRKSFMIDVRKRLEHLGIKVDISSKKPDSYIDYLKELAEHQIVLNTNFIADSTKVHMVGRNIETLISGALLITQDTPLLVQYFQKGQHYVHASTPIEAADMISYFLKHPDELSQIAKNGQKAALHYATNKLFVSVIDQFVQMHDKRSES